MIHSWINFGGLGNPGNFHPHSKFFLFLDNGFHCGAPKPQKWLCKTGRYNWFCFSSVLRVSLDRDMMCYVLRSFSLLLFVTLVLFKWFLLLALVWLVKLNSLTFLITLFHLSVTWSCFASNFLIFKSSTDKQFKNLISNIKYLKGNYWEWNHCVGDLVILFEGCSTNIFLIFRIFKLALH